MNKVILSFDYEIYFDGGNNYEALIENTEKILSLSKKNDTKLVFFIDVLYLVKLEENNLSKAWSVLKNQVSEMSSAGHELQFHFHPHWINAVYDSKSDQWQFDKTEYSFSDIKNKYGIESARRSFNSAYQKFKDYFGKESCAYRSGGLSINESQNNLIDLLLDNDFKYDSSVMPGLKISGKYLNVDHTKYPNKNIWKIDSDSGFFEECKNDKCLIEVPVMSIQNSKINIFKRAYTSLFYRLYSVAGSKAGKESGKPFNLEIEDTLYPTSITFDKSTLPDIVLLKHFTDVYFSLDNSVMCILSHPKSYLDQSYKVFENYLQWIKAKSNVSIVGFEDLN